MSHLHHKVSALIDGELQGSARRRALAHARGCADCQRELEQTYALKQRLLGLAAAEPPADLFAVLGSVRDEPLATSDGRSRASVVARRALIGAGSMSLAVVTLAYAVGGAEPAPATVTPPLREFQAEFAGSTGLAPLADPAVEALAGEEPSSADGVPVGGPLTQEIGSDGHHPSYDAPAAVRLLRRAAAAPTNISYTGVRQVLWFGPDGQTSVRLEVQHTPSQGTSYTVTSDPGGPSTTFIARSEVATSGGLGGEPVDLLLDSYDVSVSGRQSVGGRPATIVTATRDGRLSAQFWIDDQTGLLLKRRLFDGGELARVSSLFDLHTTRAGFMQHLPPELEAPAATRLSTRYARTLTDEGWACPGALPGDFQLTLLRRLQGPHDVVHAAYSDGLSTVSVFEEHGTLDTSAMTGYRQVTSDGSSLWVREGLPTVVVWQSDDRVYTLVTDAPGSTAAELVASLPHQPDQPSDQDRLGRGLTKIGSYLNPGG